MNLLNKKIRLHGEIDISKNPTEIRIVPNTRDIWVDFGYWLEAINFMAFQAMKSQNWNKQDMLEYIQKYLDESLEDIS